jgi:opacity protein-like surface antigen
MKNRVFGSCLLAASLLFVGAPKASAQGLTVGASYDFLYHVDGDTSSAGAHFDIAKNVGMIDVVGEVGFNHFDGVTVSSYLAGGRWAFKASNPKVAPFVQVLLGAAHYGADDFGSTEFALQPGIGVDFATSNAFKIRGQYDYRRIFSDGGSNDNRLSVGLVFGFGQ